jgi:hypothetical protein
MRSARAGAVRVRASLSLALLLAVPLSAAVIDDFEGPIDWTPHPSDGVELKISRDAGLHGRGMRFDFDFHGGAGYAIARKEVSLDLPPNYEFSFWMRAEAPVNNLEFKLIDTSGENVWWVNRRELDYPREWTKIRVRKRQIEFAWGPAGGGELRHVASLEIVVTAGTGGRGTVWIDDLVLDPVDVNGRTGPLVASASSISPGHEAIRAVDGDSSTGWRSASDGEQTLTVEFGGRREFGGMTLDWDPADFATDYAIEMTEDGSQWTRVRGVSGGHSGRSFLYLPDSEARAVRLVLNHSSRGRGYAVREIAIEPPEWSKTPNDFFAAVAARSTRGSYPRYLHGEQSYWAVVGVDRDTNEALINVDGAVEPFKRGFSIEPFLRIGGRLVTWADVHSTQSLAKRSLPIPSVRWEAPGVAMTITAFASGEAEKSVLYVRYRIARTRRGSKPPAALFLALRPFQVNPPWQFLNNPGGVATVRSIAWDGSVVRVNADVRVIPVSRPARFGAASFDQGNIAGAIRNGVLPRRSSVSDSDGFAAAALEFPLDPKGGLTEVLIAVPLHAASPAPEANQKADAVHRIASETLAAVVRSWEKRLNNVSIQLPSSAPPIGEVVRSNLGWILVNRDGPAIQPGSRSYERSWIRDGSLTSSALLRLGQADAVRQFLEWFAPFQFPNGKIPCCVDHRGADPVPENDSHGEFLYAVAEYFRFTRDRAFLERMWPHVEKAVDYIDELRHQRMTDAYRAPDKRIFYGLLPESISHEGYSAKPMHSYWDDFFALKGLHDATEMAAVLGRESERARYAATRDEFERDLLESIRLSMEAHHIDYLPGCAELGDFDATSTTTALEPGGEQSRLPPAALGRTFDRYFETARGRIDGSLSWENYTPYEWRAVGAFVRLGEKERALQLVDFFFHDRRPAAWNQWAEVVWHDPATPRFIGDMPHTWVGSDFIRSALDLFAYDREDGALVIGAGIPEAWVSASPGVVVRGLRTQYGGLDLSMRKVGGMVRVKLGGDSRPPGGFIIRSPLDRPPKSATVNGASSPLTDAREIRVGGAPATIEFRY